MARDYSNQSVLIVDDDTEFLKELKARVMARFDRVEIYDATDGNTAVQTWERKSPDVVILDAMLPKKSGFLVLEKMKARKSTEAKPYVVMISMNKGKRYQACAEVFGASEYMAKPQENEGWERWFGKLLDYVEVGLERFV